MKLRKAQSREIPALCSNCGYIFNTHTGYFPNEIIEILGKIYEKENSKSVITGLEGHTQCIKCKSKANFRTDLFDIVKDTFEELKSLGLPEIVLIKKLLEKITKENVSKEKYEEIKNEAEKSIPNLGVFKRFKTMTNGDIIAMIGLLFAILTYVQTALEKNEPNVKIENIYNTTLQQNITINPIEEVKGIPRNKPCPCGKNKKYKHCCGKNNK
jgi:uncharacterized protein YecA (UPF0149 family)